MIFKLMCLCLIVATDAIDPIGDFSEIIDETCLKWYDRDFVNSFLFQSEFVMALLKASGYELFRH